MPARLSSMELSPSSNPDIDPSARPSRRKSGRVVKAPELFIAQGSAKRKRVDDGDVQSEDDLRISTDESEGEPDEEEMREQKGATKRASLKKTSAKRPKTKTKMSELAIRSAPKEKPKRSRKTGQARQSAIGAASGLYAEVFTGEAELDDVVAQWLDRFKVHQTNALAEVVNFVLRCAGCPLEVNSYDIEDVDNCSSKLTDIQEEFQAHNVFDYPLIEKNKSSANFKRTLTGFFSTLIRSISTASLLFEQPVLIENIQSWVGTMSSAASRPFRHTAAFISFAIINAMCELAGELANSTAQLLRQQEGERKKKGKINQARVKSIQDQAKATTDRKVFLNEVIKDWFSTVFVHRYRDVDAKIRLDALTHLGNWIMIYPELFLDGQYLRYLGWELSDISAPARQEALKQMQRIVRDENKVAGVRVFTERFRARVVEMAVSDAEVSVRVEAVELLDALRIPGLLEPDDIDIVGKLIYDSEPRVRRAVVPFFVASVEESLSSKFDELGGQEVVEESLPWTSEDDFAQPSLTWLRFKSLAELLQSFDPDDESQDGPDQRIDGMDGILVTASSESRTTLATLAILTKMVDLRHWETLAGYLLYDHSELSPDSSSDDVDIQFKRLCKLEEKEEIILLDVLNVSVRVNLGDMTNSMEKKTKKTKAELREVKVQKDTAAQRLAVLIPKLLKKFGAAPDAASAVLRLEHTLNLDVFQELRQDFTTYAALLDDINKQFMSHESRKVLVEASNALQHAKSFEELGEVTEAKFQLLWDQTTQSLIGLCKGEDLTVRGGIDTSVLSDMTSCVLRMSHLARIADCTTAFETPRQNSISAPRRQQATDIPIAPLTLLIDLLGRGRPASDMDAKVDAIENQLVMNTMTCLMFYYMWKVANLRLIMSTGRIPHDTDLTMLAEHRAAVIAHLDAILAYRQGVDTLRFAAAGTLIDLYNMFIAVQAIPASQSEERDSIRDLAMEITPRRTATLLQVFAAIEKDSARKSGYDIEKAIADDEPDATSDEDADPVSDEEEDEEVDADVNDFHHEQLRRKHGRLTHRDRDALLAEEQLCMLASKMVIALKAGIFDKDQPHGAVRQRLCRNRAKLGNNFKEIIASLDKQSTRAGKAKKAAEAKAGQAGNGMKMKNKQLVESDESDTDDEQIQVLNDEETMRVNGLGNDEGVVEDDAIAESNGTGNDDDAHESESVIGD